MAIKLDGNELNMHGQGDEVTHEITEYSDDFILFENNSKILNLDLKKLELNNRTMTINIINNMGTCRVVVDESVTVICNVENEDGIISNKSISDQESTLVINGNNILGEILIRHTI